MFKGEVEDGRNCNLQPHMLRVLKEAVRVQWAVQYIFITHTHIVVQSNWLLPLDVPVESFGSGTFNQATTSTWKSGSSCWCRSCRRSENEASEAMNL